jgi:hypothetical protein
MMPVLRTADPAYWGMYAKYPTGDSSLILRPKPFDSRSGGLKIWIGRQPGRLRVVNKNKREEFIARPLISEASWLTPKKGPLAALLPSPRKNVVRTPVGCLLGVLFPSQANFLE